MSVVLYFDEILLDPSLFSLGDTSGGPEYANANIRSPQTGITNVAVVRYDAPLVWQCNFRDIKFDPSQPSSEGLKYFFNMWYGGLGSAYGFRLRNQFDFFTQGEVLGNGDGSTHDFKLTKKYQRPGTTGHPYFRRVVKPVVSTNLSVDSVTLHEPDGTTARVIEVPFAVYLAGTPQVSGFTISNTTGILHFTTAPGIGVEVKVDYQFDVPARFLVNRPDMKADFPGEVQGMTICEILPAELGIT